MTEGGSCRDASALAVLKVRDLDKEVELIKAAFGAKIIEAITAATGERRRVVAKVGDTEIKLEEAKGDGPGEPASVLIRVTDLDETCRIAVDYGASVIEEPGQTSGGIRQATVKDKEGHTWRLTQTPGKLTTKDVERRLAAQRRSRM